MRLERLFVTEHADMADTGGRDHAQDAVDQAEASAQDGHDSDLLTGERRLLRRADWGLHGLGGEGQIAGRFVGDEHTDLADQLAEVLDAGVLVAHDRQLMRNERMIHNMYVFSKCFRAHDDLLCLFCYSIIFSNKSPDYSAACARPAPCAGNWASGPPRHRGRPQARGPSRRAPRRSPAAAAAARGAG